MHPGAVGSVVLAVNFPNNCDRALLPDSAETNPASANSAPFIDRVRFTRTQFEAIWNGDASCGPVDRGVPDARAGRRLQRRSSRASCASTTRARPTRIKDFLDRINPARGWLTTYTTPDTRTWPNANGRPAPGLRRQPAGTARHAPDQRLRERQRPARAEAADGRRWHRLQRHRDRPYQRLRDHARRQPGTTTSSGPRSRTRASAFSGADRRPERVPHGRAEGRQLPRRDVHRSPDHGHRGLPATTGDWSNASGVDSPNGYVICTLTYGLAFDDNKNAYALQPDQTAEEAKARTVKDYWTSIISDAVRTCCSQTTTRRCRQRSLELTDAGVNVDLLEQGRRSLPGGWRPDTPGRRQPRRSTSSSCSRSTSALRVARTSTHGAPLAVPSCNPPVETSNYLTIGAPDTPGTARRRSSRAP